MPAVTYCLEASPSAGVGADAMVASLQAGLAGRWGVAQSDLVLNWQEVDSCDEGAPASDRRRVLGAASARTEANATRIWWSGGLAARPAGVAPLVADAPGLVALTSRATDGSGVIPRGRSLTASLCAASLITFAQDTTGVAASVAIESTLCIVAAPPSPPLPPQAPPPPSPPPPPPPSLPPSPPSLPPFVMPMLVRGATLIAATADSLTVQWELPSDSDAGTYALSRYVLHACEVPGDDGMLDTVDVANATSLPCTSVTAEPSAVSATVVLGPPAGRHFVLSVEAQSDASWSAPDGGLEHVEFGKVLSSGNASVSGGAGQSGPTFMTHAPPGRASAPVLAPPTAGLDNETSLHATWQPPPGNGLPLLWHELMVDVAPFVGAEGVAANDLDGGGLAPSPAGVDAEQRSDADDSAALAAAAADDAEVACDAAASVGCSDVADGRCYADLACYDPRTAGCGVGGHPLCRACVAASDAAGPAASGAACPPAGALRGAVVLAGGGLRVRLEAGSSAQGGGPMQVLLRGLPSGSVHTLAVRAHNSLGAGAFSAVATLRTAGEPSQLLLEDAAALSVTTIAGGGGGGLVGAVVLAICIVSLCRFCRTLDHVQLTKRSSHEKEERSRKVREKREKQERDDAEAEFRKMQEALRPRAAQDQQTALWALLDTPLSRSEVPGVDDADGIEVSRVLTYLAKEQVKFEREETNRANAQKRKESRKPSDLAGSCEANPLAAGQGSPAAGAASGSSASGRRRPKHSLRASAIGKLQLQGKKDAGNGLALNEEAERAAVGTYLMRCFGAESYAKPTERETTRMARMLRTEGAHFVRAAQPDENERDAVHQVRQPRRALQRRDSPAPLLLPSPSSTAVR